MPAIKACFSQLRGLSQNELPNLATRIAKVAFDVNSDFAVIGLDKEYPRLNVELAQRRLRNMTVYDEAERTFVNREAYDYRRMYFTLDTAQGVASTPGARRDFHLLSDLVKRCGVSAELTDFYVELTGWTKAVVKMYDTAQLGQLVLESFYAEPKLIGRYTAKSVDNRLDLKLVEESAGRLRSIRLSFFHEGVRRAVEARNDGVLTASSSDEDDLAHFFHEQAQVMLKHATAADAAREKANPGD